jgi:F420 biosynthesis protein FbiB-like protein
LALEERMSPARSLREVLVGRRSVRHFQDRDLPNGLVERLLAASARAPSAHNAQPWRFAVIEPGEARLRLARAMAARFRADLEDDGVAPARLTALLQAGERRLVAAPGLVAVCLDRGALASQATRRRRGIEWIMAVQGVAAATTTLLLAAEAEGVGGFWLSAPLFAPAPVRQALALPSSWEPQAMVLLGYPASEPVRSARLPLESIILRRPPR